MDVTKLGLDGKCVQTEIHTQIFLEDISYANIFLDILIKIVLYFAYDDRIKKNSIMLHLELFKIICFNPKLTY